MSTGELPATRPTNELILTVGLPRTGKSTWARNQRFPIVNPDSIRLALHGQPFIGEAEPFVWAIAKTMARALFRAGHNRVIVDATNTTAERRAFWLSRDWERNFVIFHDIPGPELIYLLKCRAAEQYADDDKAREGLQKAIDRMAEHYESVTAGELAEWEDPGVIWTPEAWNALAHA